ncbi:PmeII family type II restriction endonuclease [Flagellimonas sediminis]|uniref:Cytosolic protein n=1 Tax=Flagellimonas sediminis TaxID=2696468 RepID=A0A6I5KTP9_9FLAO|nr:PmeII family type II restriction endonuclease [Allomuricauda sediminis]NDV43079.1 cytosolic protein [Allomuricauda sediminis]
MNELNLDNVNQYVEDNIGTFHSKRIEKVKSLKLKDVLKKKNPYLFRAKNVLIATDLVKGIVDAYMSSSEEGIFGDWLEGLAIFINESVYNGRKSGIPGVDLEFDRDGIRNIVSIKSGPNWGNDSQYKKMIDNFNSARRVLRTSGSMVQVKAVCGCCYGKSSKRFEYKEKGDYYKLCGQSFWQFISGDSELYKEIIIPLGYKAQEKNEEFYESYSQMINKFTTEFANDFCDENNSIDWNKLIEFNSKKN